MNADRIVALVALVSAILCGTGLPSRLELGPHAVALIGGLIVGLASTGRGIAAIVREWLRARKAGEQPKVVAPPWQDLLGALLGCVAVGLGIEHDAIAIADPDAFASLSSLAAMLFAWQRGGGGPRPPGMTGLALLVLST